MVQGLTAALGTQARSVAVKDNIATLRGFTTGASRILRDHKSPFEAHVVQQLGMAKARLIGKTNLDEFGMGSHSVNSCYGRVKNRSPFEGHSAGGSSGGSAMAVATSAAKIGLGTDTGGSVRLPAAYTGTVGFKPSYGLISRWGVIPYANSLDTVGIIATKTATVFDAFQRINGYDPRDPTSLKPNSRRRMSRGILPLEQEQHKRAAGERKSSSGRPFANIKIGVPAEYNIAELDEGVRQAWDDALSILQSNGALIVPISLPNTRHALSAYYVLAPAEAASNLAKYDGVRYGFRGEGLWDGRGDVLYSETRGDGFGEEVKRRILLGSYTLSSEAIDNYFIQAQKVRRLVQQDFDRVFAKANPLQEAEQYDLSDMDESIMLNDKLGPSQVDFIITPTAPTPPPLLSDLKTQTPVDAYMNDVFTVPASLAGIPAISIPFPSLRARHQVVPGQGFVGIQIMGQHSDDLHLLFIAQKFEQLIADLTEDIQREMDRIVRFYECASNVVRPSVSAAKFRGIRPHFSRKGDKIRREERTALGEGPRIIKEPRRGARHRTPKELQEELEQSLDASLSLWESSRDAGNIGSSYSGD